MRLIDADRLNPDRMTNKGTVAISQSQIAKAPTVNAIPMSALEDIKTEIINIPITDTDGHSNNWYREPQAIIDDVIEIIDRYRKRGMNGSIS